MLCCNRIALYTSYKMSFEFARKVSLIGSQALYNMKYIVDVKCELSNKWSKCYIMNVNYLLTTLEHAIWNLGTIICMLDVMNEYY